MKYKIITLIALILLMFINVGCSSSEDSYWVVTDSTRYVDDYHTDSFDIEENTIVLHGYWIVDGVRYADDYILNLAYVEAIWHDNTLLYPVNKKVATFWENVKSGNVPIRWSVPVWPFYLVLACILLFFLRFAIWGMLKYLFNAVSNLNIIPHLCPTGESFLANEITLPESTQGIIATREWNIKKHNLLVSANQGMIYKEPKVIADEIPTKENNNGIYAYRFGTNMRKSWAKVSGVVSLSGKCVGHTNGLIRAEKCRILFLFCLWPGVAKELSARYKVPVMLTLDKKSDIEKFLISDEGVKWLKHNADIIKGDFNNIEQDIEEIFEKEGF